MSITNPRELKNTEEKLVRLNRLYASAAADRSGSPEGREAELESLQRQINKLKEEITRFTTGQRAAS